MLSPSNTLAADRSPDVVAGVARRPSGFQNWIAIAVILAAGLALRLYRLDAQSIWFDEASSIVASQGTFAELQSRLVRASSHPPGHYYLLFAAFKLLGFGTWQARFVSALFGTLAIGALYALGSAMFNRRTALIAAALLVTSQLGVLYSQEARPYAAFLFLSIVTELLFLDALQTKRPSRWWLATLAATLMIYTHYYGVFLVFALFLFWFLRRSRYPISAWWWAGGALACATLLAPWVLGGMRAQLAYWTPIAVRSDLPSWFRVTWITPIRTLNMFNNGKFAGVLNSAPKWAFVAGAVIYTVPALAAVWSTMRVRGVNRDRRFEDAILFLVLAGGVPVALIAALGGAKVVFDVRYVSFCIAPYYLLVAAGMDEFRRPALRRASIAVALAYGAASLSANYTIPYKENYRDALAYLAAEYRPEDVCVFEPPGIPLQWQVYHQDREPLRTATLQEVESGQFKTGRVWLITYLRSPFAERRGRDAEEQLARMHSKLAERRYFWVQVSVYVSAGL
jgi:uncharacterized membrane protein